MVSQLIQTLGEEKYFCIDDRDGVPLNDNQVNMKKWKCVCCSKPVWIEATNENGDKESYLRLSIKDVEREDYVYIPKSGFIRVLATGKESNGYFIALEKYSKVTKLTENYFCLTLPSGRFIRADA
jgi:superfamily I DNA and/or RNA helicase